MGNLFTTETITEDYIPPPRSHELTDEFLQKMPKVELHAHLNGSLNYNSIRELSENVFPKDSAELAELAKNFVDSDGLNLNNCFEKFKFMHQLTSTRQGLKMATLQVIRDFALDGVIYLELRTTPKVTADMTKRDYLNCVLDAINVAKTRYRTIRVKLLPSIDRSQSVLDAEETLNEVMELCRSNSYVIPGIDFSGNPNCGEFKQFIPVLQRARDFGLKLAIHCAETDNPKEIDEMLKFGMDRCGHGTFLSAKQIELLSRRRVAIECCLTSNVKCGSVPDFKDHHFRRIFVNRRIPVLCTDDSGVFETTLTQEFIKAVVSFGLDKRDLIDLSCNAEKHSFAETNEKEIMELQIFKYFKFGYRRPQ